MRAKGPVGCCNFVRTGDYLPACWAYGAVDPRNAGRLIVGKTLSATSIGEVCTMSARGGRLGAWWKNMKEIFLTRPNGSTCVIRVLPGPQDWELVGPVLVSLGKRLANVGISPTFMLPMSLLDFETARDVPGPLIITTSVADLRREVHITDQERWAEAIGQYAGVATACCIDLGGLPIGQGIPVFMAIPESLGVSVLTGSVETALDNACVLSAYDIAYGSIFELDLQASLGKKKVAGDMIRTLLGMEGIVSLMNASDRRTGA